MGLGNALYHYDPGNRLGNKLLGYLPAHRRVVSRYGSIIEPEVLDTAFMEVPCVDRFHEAR